MFSECVAYWSDDDGATFGDQEFFLTSRDAINSLSEKIIGTDAEGRDNIGIVLAIKKIQHPLHNGV